MKIKFTILTVATVSLATILGVVSSGNRASSSRAGAASIVSTNGLDLTITKEMVPTVSGNYVHSVTLNLGR